MTGIRVSIGQRKTSGNSRLNFRRFLESGLRSFLRRVIGGGARASNQTYGNLGNSLCYTSETENIFFKKNLMVYFKGFLIFGLLCFESLPLQSENSHHESFVS